MPVISNQYIAALVAPRAAKKDAARKVWSVDLEATWVPFFAAANASGLTAIEPAELGAPLRLAREKSGEVRFSSSGKPVIRVAKGLADGIAAVRENFIANITNFTGKVQKADPEKYKAELDKAVKAGKPIVAHDTLALSVALEARRKAEAEAEAETGVVNQAEMVADAHAEAKELQPA